MNKPRPLEMGISNNVRNDKIVAVPIYLFIHRRMS